MLNKEHTDRAFDACTPYLQVIDRAIQECQDNLERLRGVRGAIKRELLGENLNGISAVLGNAGPPLSVQDATAGRYPPDIAAELEEGLETALTDELAKG